MLSKTLFVSLLASSAMTLAIAAPAGAASTSDRAREAIAAAEAKIHTVDILGASADAPRDAAGAQAALASAREDFASGDKESAIDEAIHASALADTAIGISQQHKNDAIASAREAQRQDVSAAQDQAAAAQQQAAVAVSAAQDQAATAQQQAAAANARADAAQQSAAMSAAAAAAARDAAAAVTQPQVETTVTTQQPGGAHHATRTHITRHIKAPAAVAPSVTTTTSVTQP